jgi:hypothetical protein
MLWKTLLFVALSLVLHGVVKLLGRLWPREQAVATSDWPPEMLAKVARRANFAGTLAALVVFLFLLPGWILLAWWLDSRLWPALRLSESLAVSMQLLRLARGAIAAWALAGAASLVAMRALFAWRYDLMLAAGNRHFGFDASRFFYWCFVWIVPFCLEFEIHSLGYCAHLSDKGLVLHDSPLWPPSVHDWRQLKSIELARPFNENPAAVGRAPEMRLTFQDGTTFTDVPWTVPWDQRGKRVPWDATCQWISAISGVKVQVVPKIP